MSHTTILLSPLSRSRHLPWVHLPPHPSVYSQQQQLLKIKLTTMKLAILPLALLTMAGLVVAQDVPVRMIQSVVHVCL